MASQAFRVPACSPPGHLSPVLGRRGFPVGSGGLARWTGRVAIPFRASRGRAALTHASSRTGEGVGGPSPSLRLSRGLLPELQGWRAVGESWVLNATAPPKAVVHFLGGAFIGAAPHLSYAALMEALVSAGYVVVCTPYQLTFKHIQSAERVCDMFDEALSTLAEEDPGVDALPVFGIGHSNGSLLQLLLGTFEGRQPRVANVLMSFNSKPVSEAIPGGLPSGVGPLLGGLRDAAGALPFSQALRVAEEVLDQTPVLPTASELREDGIVRSMMPVARQIGGVLSEIADGVQEFTPTPAESKRLIADAYGVPNNLLVMFNDDPFDETPDIRDILAGMEGKRVDVEVMEGWHGAPCGVDVDWTPSASFSPADALGQAVKEEVLRNTRTVAARVVRWLDSALDEQ